ncbi:MAG TPA: TetR/AcrR family transcriptional regulator [Beutenbergiaceae bacterium]|nr:TetR/AcrR family transcriptional regulator [Beutenbergiaceae bacterium]
MARPRSYDHTLRRSLLDACSEVISRRGVDGVSLRELARGVGTSTAAVYALFGGREELIAAVTQEGYSRFAQHLSRVPRTDDPAADLFALGLAYRDSALDDPHFYRVMFGPAPGAAPSSEAPAPAPAPADLGALDGARSHAPSTEQAAAAERDEPFRMLRMAVGRLVPEEQAAAGAYRLWALVHGLVSLELAGLLPGTPDQRAVEFQQTLRAAGPALLGRRTT